MSRPQLKFLRRGFRARKMPTRAACKGSKRVRALKWSRRKTENFSKKVNKLNEASRSISG